MQNQPPPSDYLPYSHRKTNSSPKYFLICIVGFIMAFLILIQLTLQIHQLKALTTQSYHQYETLKNMTDELKIQNIQRSTLVKQKYLNRKQKSLDQGKNAKNIPKKRENSKQEDKKEDSNSQQNEQAQKLAEEEKNQKNNEANDQNSMVKIEENKEYEDLEIDEIEIQQKLKPQIFQTIWDEIEDGFRPALQYFQIHKIPNIKQLPFCVVASASQWNQQFITSLKNQNYGNYHSLIIGNQTTSIKSQPNVKFINSLEGRGFYYHFKDAISQNCQQKSIVFIARAPLANPNVLSTLNQDFQTLKIWLTYDGNKTSYQIVAFYRQLYYSVDENDFQNSNLLFLKQDNFDCTVIGLLELSSRFIIRTFTRNFYNSSKLNQQFLFSSDKASLIYKSGRSKYESLHFMRYNAPIDLKTYQYNFARRYSNTRERENLIDKQRILMFLDMIELKNLPLNHSLFELDDLYYQQKYQLSKLTYEKRLCVVIPSFNNVPNSRYKKILDTVFYQKYQNYHIVFIDDHSSDKTLEKTKEYVQTVYKFPQDRIAYIYNEQQQYATYNIRNAAYNYCKPDDIFVLIDGDDQLVGRNIFQILNSAYQDPQFQYWIVYTNFYSTQYNVGSSKFVPDHYLNNPQFYRHYPRHFFGMVRSFITKLFLKIRDKDHKDLQHKYFQILYDQSMQAPMFEMAGQHIKYIPQLCYLYNRHTEVNVEVRKELRLRRDYLFKLLRVRKTYQALDKL